MDIAVWKMVENIEADLAELSAKDRIAFLKSYLEKNEPERKKSESIPGTEIGDLEIKIINPSKKDEGAEDPQNK